MSGKNQHFIPRFLQEGFRAQSKGKKTYLHHRTRGAVLTSIGSIGSENYFYSRSSENGETTLDDVITDEEALLSKQMVALRELPIGAFVGPDIASKMVSHFAVRTRNVRDFFGTAGDLMIQDMSESISDVANCARLLGLDQPEPNDLWRDFIGQRKAAGELLALLEKEWGAPKALVERFVFMGARELIFSNHGENIGSFLGALEDLRSMLKQSLPEFHNSALQESRSPQKRRETLAALRWQICAAPKEGAILPDCVVLAGNSDNGLFVSYVMAVKHEIEVVIMPISSGKMLIGVRGNATLPSLVSFNSDAAANCAEFFVASQKTDVTEALVAVIGTAWSGQIDGLLDSSLQEYRPIPIEGLRIATNYDGDAVLEEHRPGTDFEGEIARIVRHYYTTCPESCNLERLEAITFTDQQNSFLTEIDVGPAAEVSTELSVQEVFGGVALLHVRRDELVKSVILLEDSFRDSLISTDPNQRELASSTVLACLSHVSALGRIEANIPGYMSTPALLSDHDALVHCAIRSPIRAYWAGRDVAIAGKADALIPKAESYTLETLASSIEDLNRAKLKLLETEDNEAYFTSLVATMSKLLAQVAQLIGLKHGWGTNDDALLSPSLTKAFAPFELKTWVIIFGRDLRAIWQRDKLALSDLYTMNIHVERVLMSFGVLLWKDATSGSTCVSPFDYSTR